AKASHQTRSETNTYALAAAGDQAAADVDARTLRLAEPGDGRESDARGSADRRTPARRNAANPGKDGTGTAGEQDRHVGRPGLRIFLRRLSRSEEHTSELQSLAYLVCRLLLEKKNNKDS